MPCNDIRVELHRPITRRTDFDLMGPGVNPSGCVVGVNSPAVPTYEPSMNTSAVPGVISKLTPPVLAWP